MKIGPGVSELWVVENRPLPLTRPIAYTTACTTVQAVICISAFLSNFYSVHCPAALSMHFLSSHIYMYTGIQLHAVQ